MVTTVGPYLQYGEPLVAACAEAGTDYVDLTGEPEFVDRMYLAHHATAAVATGARIVHACGFDSIPHDLGALLHRAAAARRRPVDAARRRPGRRRMLSGGTFHSAMSAISRARQMRDAAAGPPASRGRRPEGRSSRAVAGKPHRDAVLGYWLLPLPTIDPSSWPAAAPRWRRTAPSSATPTTPAPRPCAYAAGGAAGAGALVRRRPGAAAAQRS